MTWMVATGLVPVARHLPHAQQEKVSLIMEDLTDVRREQIIKVFLHLSHTFGQGLSAREGLAAANGMLNPFIERFHPVLRHYRPEVIGQCLALALDAPELHLSELHGFGMDMKAGDHPQDREAELGSFRDDGTYLAMQAYDYLHRGLLQ